MIVWASRARDNLYIVFDCLGIARATNDVFYVGVLYSKHDRRGPKADAEGNVLPRIPALPAARFVTWHRTLTSLILAMF